MGPEEATEAGTSSEVAARGKKDGEEQLSDTRKGAAAGGGDSSNVKRRVRLCGTFGPHTRSGSGARGSGRSATAERTSSGATTATSAKNDRQRTCGRAARGGFCFGLQRTASGATAAEAGDDPAGSAEPLPPLRSSGKGIKVKSCLGSSLLAEDEEETRVPLLRLKERSSSLDRPPAGHGRPRALFCGLVGERGDESPRAAAAGDQQQITEDLTGGSAAPRPLVSKTLARLVRAPGGVVGKDAGDNNDGSGSGSRRHGRAAAEPREWSSEDEGRKLREHKAETAAKRRGRRVALVLLYVAWGILFWVRAAAPALPCRCCRVSRGPPSCGDQNPILPPYPLLIPAPPIPLLRSYAPLTTHCW